MASNIHRQCAEELLEVLMWREDSSLPRGVYTDKRTRTEWVDTLLSDATRGPFKVRNS